MVGRKFRFVAVAMSLAFERNPSIKQTDRHNNLGCFNQMCVQFCFLFFSDLKTLHNGSLTNLFVLLQITVETQFANHEEHRFRGVFMFGILKNSRVLNDAATLFLIPPLLE